VALAKAFLLDDFTCCQAPSFRLPRRTGLIVELGALVLRSACREAVRWATPLKVAVNVSPRQFQHTDMVHVVASVLNDTKLAPWRLELEITEGVIINDMAGAAVWCTG
jgi:EAL domain-containing protein (putative c-di-GMP-specific phosphodiesterase class I)